MTELVRAKSRSLPCGIPALLGLLLCGCSVLPAIKPPEPLALGVVDPAALVKWNAVTDTKTGAILCPKCLQGAIRPRWYRDPGRVECLQWACGNCGATWRSVVATDLKTVP